MFHKSFQQKATSMKHILLIFCCLAVLACRHVPPAPVSVNGPSDMSAASVHELTRQLMEKCGVNEQIENVPEKTMAEVRECFRRNESILGPMSDGVVDEIGTIIARTFNPVTIRAILAGHIEERLSVEDMRAVLRWLDSPLGLKLTAIEKAGSTPEAYQKMVDAVPTLRQTPDYEERLGIVQDIDRSVRATELIVDRMINMQVITLTAMGSAFPSMNMPSESAMRESFEKNRQALTDTIAREMALSIFFTYRDVSREELKEYLRFMNTDIGKRYHEVIQEGSNAAYTYCGKKFSAAVVQRIKTREEKEREEEQRVKEPSPVYPQTR